MTGGSEEKRFDQSVKLSFLCDYALLQSWNTFNEELRGAFLLPHLAAVRRVIGQGAVVDGEVAHVADALKDVPQQRAGGY